MYNNYGGLALPDPNAQDPYLPPTFAILPSSPVPQATYIHPELRPEALKQRRARLTSTINGLHRSWQVLLKTPLTNGSLIFLDCKHLYPLSHHQEAMALWKMYNPKFNSPGMGFDLINMKGDICDTRHPPHPLLELIAATINGSPHKALTSREIRLSLMVRYTYFIYQDYQWHAQVTATLQDHPEHFLSAPRTPTLYDPGNVWKLRADWPLQTVDEQPNWEPPKAVEPPIQITYPMELGPETRVPGADCPPQKFSRSLRLNPISNEAAGRTVLPGLDSLNVPEFKGKAIDSNHREVKRKTTSRTKKNAMPGTLSVEEVRTGWTGIARASLDAKMKQQGRDLLKEWANPVQNRM